MADGYSVRTLAHCSEAVDGFPPEVAKAFQQPAEPSLFVHLVHLQSGAQGVGLFRAYRNDLKGLAMAEGLCAVLVALLWGIMQF